MRVVCRYPMEFVSHTRIKRHVHYVFPLSHSPRYRPPSMQRHWLGAKASSFARQSLIVSSREDAAASISRAMVSAISSLRDCLRGAAQQPSLLGETRLAFQWWFSYPQNAINTVKAT